MKTTGAIWNAYLSSWPEGQWFDDSDEAINGTPLDGGEAPANAEVTFTCGVVYRDDDDREGVSLVRHFRRWLKEQSVAFVQCEVPKDRLDELKAAVQSLGGKVRV